MSDDINAGGLAPEEGSRRAQIVTEAISWLRTPWHHAARVKGAGVDCAQLLIAVYAAVGVIPPIDLGYYPPDWHLHKDRPRFLEILSQYADPLEPGVAGLPGDIAMFRFGRHAAHGAIVQAWPLVIHAYRDERMVAQSDVQTNGALAGRLAGLWRVRGVDGASGGGIA